MRYQFSVCILDTERHLLYRSGIFQPVRPKVFQLLAYLLSQHGRVVSKQELSERIWSDRIVSESTLETCIKEARRAVGDTGRAQRVIKTRYRLGYSITTDVVVLPGGSEDRTFPVVESQSTETSDLGDVLPETIGPRGTHTANITATFPEADLTRAGDIHTPVPVASGPTHMSDELSIYQEVLVQSRPRYHKQVARTLTAGFPNTARKLPAVVAHHYTEANERLRAIVWWRRAALDASQRMAHEPALHHGRAGLSLLKTLPNNKTRKRLELEFKLIVGRALMETQGFFAPEVARIFTRVQELCEQAGKPRLRATALTYLRILYAGRGAFRTARKLAEEFVDLAQNTNDPTLLRRARADLGATLAYQGEFAKAQSYWDAAEIPATPPNSRDVYNRSIEAPFLWVLGYPDQALSWALQCVSTARKQSWRSTLLQSLFCTSLVHYGRRDSIGLHQTATMLLRLAADWDRHRWIPFSKMAQGYAMALQGKLGDGHTQMQVGLDEYEAFGAGQSLPVSLAMLADLYRISGRTEDGLDAVHRGISASSAAGGYWCESELYRLKGELLLAQSSANQTKAKSIFGKSIEIARRQKARSWELRTATSLSRMLRLKGKETEARQLLASVYNSFSEGLNTDDLKEAEILLM